MDEKQKNILIVRTDRIGDVVLTTPAIAALRNHFPNERISILVSAQTVDLVVGNPNLDDVLVDDRRGRNRGLFGFWQLVMFLRKRKFDIAINFHTKRRTNLLLFLAGIPQRIGYRNEKWGFLLTDPLEDERASGIKHESQYCLDVLQMLGVDEPAADAYVPVQEQGRIWFEEELKRREFFHARPWIVIHSGSSCPTKKWPVSCFAELMTLLEKKYQCGFILIGGADNCETVQELLAHYGKEGVLNLTGQVSLAQLVAVLSSCDLLVSNDSGPVHIAAALGMAVVSIFTRNQPGINPQRWKPLGERSVFVAPALDMSLSFVSGRVNNTQYLYQITPQDVMAAVDAVF